MSAHILDEPGENRNEFIEVIVARLTPLSRNPQLVAEFFAQKLKLFAAEGVRFVEDQRGLFNQEKPDVKSTGIEYRFQKTIIRFLSNVEEQIARLHQFKAAHKDIFVGMDAAGRDKIC